MVRFENRLFQITQENQNRPQPKRRSIVRKKLEGSIVILWNDKPFKTIEILPNKEDGQSGYKAA